MSTSSYPVHVEARLDSQLSRGLWLVKWLLAIPHYIVLAFLWLGFVVLSVVAFFAILFTGRYPSSIFAFNVGVLRWGWRVAYYSYGTLGTDRYPPFTLDEVPDYPTHLSVDYPQRLSRGLVLVKWWLLAIPHYLVLGFLLGGGAYVTNQTASTDGWRWTGSGGLIGLLVLIAAVVLLFTGRYPQSIFDLVLGLNRWVLRVVAYAGLMTDVYPPFRLDQGGPDADDTRRLAAPSDAAATPEGDEVPAPTTAGVGATGGPTAAQGQHPADQSVSHTPSRTWGAGRVITLVAGSVVLVLSLTLIAAGAVLGLADRARRDNAGFLISDTQTLTTSSYAIASPSFLLESDISPTLPGRLIGEVNLTVTPSNNKPVFVGIAPTRDVTAYLAGVGHTTVVRVTDSSGPVYRDAAGGAPTTRPADTGIWAASSAGEGTRTLVWSPRTGDWTVVVMNADGTAGVNARVAAGATLPILGAGATALLVSGLCGLLLAAALITAALLAANRAQAKPAIPPAR